MTGAVIAGIGCRRGCPAEAILVLLRDAAARTGRAVTALAAPAFKAEEPGLREAAHRLGLALDLIERPALAAAQPFCLTRSARAELAAGVPSVAEGCALAAAGPGARLILPRIAGNGATCALAEATSS